MEEIPEVKCLILDWVKFGMEPKGTVFCPYTRTLPPLVPFLDPPIHGLLGQASQENGRPIRHPEMAPEAMTKTYSSHLEGSLYIQYQEAALACQLHV
jgi:hypothetical protein